MKVSAQCNSGGVDSVVHLLLTACSNHYEVALLFCMLYCPGKTIQLVGKEQAREKIKKDNYLEPCYVCAISSLIGVREV